MNRWRLILCLVGMAYRRRIDEPELLKAEFEAIRRLHVIEGLYEFGSNASFCHLN